MVNINISIPETIHKQVKIKCALDNSTLKNYIISALNDAVDLKK